MQIQLKYGCNPHQESARLIVGDENSFEILNGQPSYINILDALYGWQLVKELDEATGAPAAVSFKHVSPAGAAIAGDLTDDFLDSQFLEKRYYSPISTAYIRARGGDRMCSYGDAAAVSRMVDSDLASILKSEVCDLIIAPDFEPEALNILKSKKKGSFIIIRIDHNYLPARLESRDVYGLTLQQNRNDIKISTSHFDNIVSIKNESDQDVLKTMLVATISLKYTQSNSISIAKDGQIIGIGAGQQSRVHCTRLACDKAEKWLLQQHPKVISLNFVEGLKRFDKTNLIDQYLLFDILSKHEKSVMLKGFKTIPEPLTLEERQDWLKQFSGICLSSDAYIPFRDNIDRASRTNVKFVAHAGGALRDDDVTKAANEYGMTMFHTGLRLFTH